MSTRWKYAISARLALAATVAAFGSVSPGLTSLAAQAPKAGAAAAERDVQPPPGLGDSLREADWDTFSAEVTMRRHLVSPAGAVSGEAPAVRYRWTRRQRGNGWSSAIEIVQLAAPRIRTAHGQLALTEPSAVLRVEDDEDGSGPRVYDRGGRAIRLPSTEDRRVLGEPVAGSLDVPRLPQLAAPEFRHRGESGRGWVEGFIAQAAQAPARREALQRRFGRSPGKLRSLDRFVRREGRETIEVLADATGVVVEMNVGQDGELVSRSVVGYVPRADGALVRRSVRSEHRLPGRAERAVSMMELADVRLERRGVR